MRDLLGFTPDCRRVSASTYDREVIAEDALPSGSALPTDIAKAESVPV